MCRAGSADDVDPHHLTTAGTGIKGDDRRSVPLRNDLHREIHHIGRIAFEKRHNIDLNEENVKALMKYVEHLEGK